MLNFSEWRQEADTYRPALHLVFINTGNKVCDKPVFYLLLVECLYTHILFLYIYIYIYAIKTFTYSADVAFSLKLLF